MNQTPFGQRTAAGGIAGLIIIGIIYYIIAPVVNPVLSQIVNHALSASPTPSPTSSPTPSQQAKALISQFYSDINNDTNNHDFWDAYNLWSSPGESLGPYNQFANGYANTLHDDITFGDITPLSDGTVSVTITISAREAIPGGTTVSTYQGTYIVGPQNGTWKILHGNIVKEPS